ncbi:uncharacterized protein TrAFT101_007708 [Trichoderma asperellum]|uniref:uncharacterized protein n=1 Tax=Trichoderma asperellum TaxID=101201 RepID=UPI00331A0E1A|nr:hypothetical protein TrAFT101_007708 [Trichoderma asperellum]
MRRVDPAKSQPTTFATPPVSGSHRRDDAGDTATPTCSRAFGLAVIDQAARLSPCADWARLMDSHAGTRGVQIKQTE